MAEQRHPQLELDIANVLAYTLTTFGTHQLFRYSQAILEAIEHVIAHPHDGRPCRAPGLQGYWFFRIARRGRRARHRLVYLITPDGSAYILRLLDDSMEIARHIPPAVRVARE